MHPFALLQYVTKEPKTSFICKCDIRSDTFLPEGLETFTAVFLCASQRLNQDFYLALPPTPKALRY